MTVIYNNNDVSVEVERVDDYEAKINFNGKNLIYISREEQEEFIKKFNKLMEKYRI